MANYKNYYFKKTTLDVVSLRHKRAKAQLCSVLTDKIELPDSLKTKYKMPDCHLGEYTALEPVLIDSCQELLKLSEHIKRQCEAAKKELEEMEEDALELEKLIGDNFVDQVVVIDGHAYLINSIGQLKPVGKIA